MERPKFSRKTPPACLRRLAALLPLLPLMGAVSVSRAGEVFKSVDAEGHVVYSDHADPDGQASVVHLEDAPAPPRVLHFCWTNCFTLELDGGLYRRTDGSDETWTIDRFTSTSFLMHRHDAPALWNGFSADVPYEGQIAGERVLSVMVGGRPVSDIQASWGAALGTLPGSNEDRDQGNSSLATTAGFIPDADAEVRTAEVPPPLQDDPQPPCPIDGFLWTPAYWAWGGGRYYWVPGAWMRPPRTGLLWTPGYWSFATAAYVFHPGYWAAHVGYYGGINYGSGYAGVGFTGGRWEGNAFAYNRAVSNLNSSITHNTYSEATTGNTGQSKVSYNGGPGGINAPPTAQERAVASEPHIPASPLEHRFGQQTAGSPALAVLSAHPTVTARKPIASNTQPAASHQPAAPSVAQPAARATGAAHTVANETPEPTPRQKEVAARAAAPKSGTAHSTSSQHPIH
jgi:hypothetical protein